MVTLKRILIWKNAAIKTPWIFRGCLHKSLEQKQFALKPKELHHCHSCNRSFAVHGQRRGMLQVNEDEADSKIVATISAISQEIDKLVHVCHKKNPEFNSIEGQVSWVGVWPAWYLWQHWGRELGYNLDWFCGITSWLQLEFQLKFF